ncbi:MAG: hypothetical protein SGJ18_06125, partial [Pseudomonadota bacterium]|nr:hypothetical protein [Pseudomonadota bacterium]
LTLSNGSAISLNQTGRLLNIRVNAQAQAVSFSLNGGTSTIDRELPFSMAGDISGDYNDWSPTVGNHSLQISVFELVDGGWRVKESLRLQFSVTE